MHLRLRHLAFVAVLLAATASAQLPASTVLAPTGIASDATGNLYFADMARHQVFEATIGGQLLLIAGNGTQGFSGDNGPATAAQLNGPQALAIDPSGTLYIADTNNHRIRSVSTSGNITTIAGTGKSGFSGDNGPATAAQLASPNALAIDANGTLYVADSANHRVRAISSSGVPTTIAGSGTQGFSGDSGPATAAALDTPCGLAISTNGTLYIADTHNHRIRAVSNGTITTVAGTGTPGFSGDNSSATLAQLDSPRGLSISTSGDLLIADANNHRIRSISPAGIITTLAGSATQGTAADASPALTASLSVPRAVALSTFGSPVLTDTPNHTLRILAADANLYLPAALSTRTSTVALTAPASTTFGQTTATVTVSGTASTPQGTVQLLQNNTPAAAATLSNGSATFLLTTMPAGSYSLAATYSGDGINPSAVSPFITVSVARAPSSTTTQPPVQNTYATLPLLLNANVTSTTKGIPTGTVNFIDTTSSTTIATAQLTNGIASSVYLAPTAGTHTIAASYLGDANFAPSTSPSVTANIQPLPDFTLAPTSSTTQTVTAGFPATYTLAVAPIAAPFTGAVSFAVTGLPFGATAAFAPPQLVPGAASTSTTLSIQTLAAPLVQIHAYPFPVSLALLTLPLLLFRRRPRRALIGLTLLALTACGTRINQAPSASAGVYNLTVSATGTNLAGATVTHTTALTLIIR